MVARNSFSMAQYDKLKSITTLCGIKGLGISIIKVCMHCPQEWLLGCHSYQSQNKFVEFAWVENNTKLNNLSKA
jgi:hypothetical protein